MPARKTGCLKDMAVFFLTPELSASLPRATIRAEDETTPQFRWVQHAKAIVWIAVAIMLGMGLGQLH